MTSYMRNILVLFLFLFVSNSASAWTLNRDFEGGTIGAKASGSHGFGSAFSKTVFTNEVVHSGSRSAKVAIAKGNTAWGEWGGVIGFPQKLSEGQEVWYRVYLFLPLDFDYSATGGGLKTMRTHTISSAGANEGYFDMLISRASWSGVKGQLYCGSEIVTTFADGRGTVVKKGKWVTFEQYVKFHSVPGKGIYRVWQDGNLVYENKKTKTLRSATSKSEKVLLFTYWNGGAPKTQHAYVDDIVITSDTPAARDSKGNPMIGLATGLKPVPYVPKKPQKPTSLKVN